MGIFGGTFDPVHCGHLILAEQCREQCRLDQILFVPAGQPPHKRSVEISPGPARAEMIEFATAGCPEFKVDRMEINRSGPSYTVDTLKALQSEDAERQLFLIIGADSLRDLPDWRAPDQIAELATILAVNRGDRPLPDSRQLAELLGKRIAARVSLATMPGIDISATDIRRRVRSGHSIRFLTPRAVEAYISEHKLYTSKYTETQDSG